MRLHVSVNPHIKTGELGSQMFIQFSLVDFFFGSALLWNYFCGFVWHALA